MYMAPHVSLNLKKKEISKLIHISPHYPRLPELQRPSSSGDPHELAARPHTACPQTRAARPPRAQVAGAPVRRSASPRLRRRSRREHGRSWRRSPSPTNHEKGGGRGGVDESGASSQDPDKRPWPVEVGARRRQGCGIGFSD
jgi:hypothetical protein